MEEELNLHSKNDAETGHAPTQSLSSERPAIQAPPVLLPAAPAGPPGFAQPTLTGARRLLVNLMMICLGCFLADGFLSLVDDSLMLFGIAVFGGIRGFVLFSSLATGALLYCLMGITPLVPKRIFLPVTLFSPTAGLVFLLCLIYCHDRIQAIALGISVGQCILGVTMLGWFRSGYRSRLASASAGQPGARGFSWLNLAAFVGINIFVILPALIIYLFVCAELAVDHFSDGFVSLRPGGLTVQVRKYIRKDGKTIQLVPMSHVGEADFYQKLAQSFPRNSKILMEGVSDNRNLLTNKISYKRMATSLGLVEQQRVFKPGRTEVVRADVDVEEFATETINFLNLAMRLHAMGFKAETILPLMQYSPSPGFEDQLFDDILRKRNRHLLRVVESQLSESDYLIIPWGAAHMPELAREIKKAGFQLDETRNYQAIRFRPSASRAKKPS